MTLRPGQAVRGFGKIELALLVALIAAVIALAVPGLKRSRITSNELAARQALLAIAAAQESWKEEAKVDQDADTLGEYGLLGELAGALIPRSGEKRVDPAFAPALFGTGGQAGADGCAVVNGYVYRIYLVQSVEESGAIIAGDDKGLGGTASAAGATLTDVEAIDHQEKSYVLYVWPLKAGVTGSRAFAVTQEPTVHETDMEAKPYSGRGPTGAANVPAVDAAFSGDAFTSRLNSAEHGGRDGNVWRPIASR